MPERTVMRQALFCEFSLERHVPADRLLRAIDRFVDLLGCAPTSSPSTARSAGLRSIPNL